MNKTADYYELLGISIFASQEEIKAGYIKKIKQYHPDTYKGNKTEAENITAGINEGYAILSDPKQKEVYDKKYGFDIQRQSILKAQEKFEKKQQKKNKKEKPQKTYATEKKQQEETRKQKEFNAQTDRSDAKPRTNIFTKKLKKDTKVVNPFAKSSDEREIQKERLFLDGIIILLLIILIFVIIFK